MPILSPGDSQHRGAGAAEDVYYLLHPLGVQLVEPAAAAAAPARDVRWAEYGRPRNAALRNVQGIGYLLFGNRVVNGALRAGLS